MLAFSLTVESYWVSGKDVSLKCSKWTVASLTLLFTPIPSPLFIYFITLIMSRNLWATKKTGIGLCWECSLQVLLKFLLFHDYDHSNVAMHHMMTTRLSPCKLGKFLLLLSLEGQKRATIRSKLSGSSWKGCCIVLGICSFSLWHLCLFLLL